MNPLTFDLTYDLNNPSSCSPNLCPVLDVLSGDSYRAEVHHAIFVTSHETAVYAYCSGMKWISS